MIAVCVTVSACTIVIFLGIMWAASTIAGAIDTSVFQVAQQVAPPQIEDAGRVLSERMQVLQRGRFGPPITK